ncbi:MAG: glycosyltransferase family 39 protein, partial [Bryobacteraceae bacterium]
MPTVLLILLGALLPVLVAWALGSLVTRKLPDVSAPAAFALGAGLESTLIFGLLCAGAATGPVLAGCCAAALLLLLARGVVKVDLVMPRYAAGVLGVYAVIYFVYALAPEIQPDGVAYHLALVAEYARLGRFPDRVGFFEMLPQGLEMLMAPAFLVGKHSAAKLVHFAFLLASVPLFLSIGRRLELREEISAAAAVFYFCAPIVGITGTSTYTDVALVFFALASADMLLVWRKSGKDRYLLAAGALAGFCYAVKFNGAFVIVAAAMLILATRRIRFVLVLGAGVALAVTPWILRNTLVAENPFAPLFNAWFPNPYFHVAMERDLQRYWRSYEGVHRWQAPWELAVGGRLQGIFGPLFLLLPMGALAIKERAGRWCAIAALMLSAGWLSNAGARFVMPGYPFLAFTLAIAAARFPRPALGSLVVLHAVACLPWVTALYQPGTTWGWPAFPLSAALRLESEEEYRIRAVGEYGLATLLRENTGTGDRIFTLVSVPRAYVERDVLTWWESAQNDTLTESLLLASLYAGTPFYDLEGAWPAESLSGVRFRLTTAHRGEWDLNEIRLYL